ncbi:LysR family transcriptional regulator [Gluconobacter kondonii]|uniref:LysR family transcriptional regulator n=1 Tax=Gluconobacter kondonii TaxID=941463 RepID=UPI001B8CB815|nr:LysR family transcriptional regulator [Gluconobacter kondonii]MBS1081659.1 LysR family transcriptional regulator [Gluconobacter kondonii]
MDRLTSMTIFRDAVAQGSLAAAARSHGLSSEMASRHLRALEKRLGVRLLNRSTRKLSLTAAGDAYLGRCTAILDEIASTEALAATLQASPTGLLRVAAPLAFANASLGPALDAYLKEYPGVSLALDLTERVADIVGEGYDVALRLGALPDSAMTARKLAEFPLVLVAAPGYLVGAPDIVSPEELERHEVLIYTQTARPNRITLKDAAGQKVSVALSGRVSASDIGILLELARRGFGPVFAPLFLVEHDLREGRLQQIMMNWTARALPLHAVLPNRFLTPSAARSFIEFMADWFRG